MSKNQKNTNRSEIAGNKNESKFDQGSLKKVSKTNS